MVEKVFCHLCGVSVTVDKVVVIGEGCFCNHCAISRLQEIGGEMIAKEGKPRKKRLRWFYFFTMILGLIPGVGHLYLGLMGRGIQLFIALLVGIFCMQIYWPLVLIVPLVFFYSFFDLLQIVRAKKRGEKVEDCPFIQRDEFPRWLKEQRKWGFGFVFLGMVSLLEMSSLWSSVVQKGVLSVMLLGTGTWLLLSTRAKKSGNTALKGSVAE